jgi:hypothetical protein
MVAVGVFKRLSKPPAGSAADQGERGRLTILGPKLMDPRADPQALLPLLQRRYEGAVARIEQIVNQDSGSFTPDGVNRVADLVERDLRLGGWLPWRRCSGTC